MLGKTITIAARRDSHAQETAWHPQGDAAWRQLWQVSGGETRGAAHQADAGQKNEGVGEHVRVEVYRGSAACDCGDAISTPYEECPVAEPSFRRIIDRVRERPVVRSDRLT